MQRSTLVWWSRVCLISIACLGTVGQEVYAGGVACACEQFLRKLDPSQIPAVIKLTNQPEGVLGAFDAGDRPVLAMAFLEYGRVLAVAESGPSQRDAGPPGRIRLFDLSGTQPRDIGSIDATEDQIISMAVHPFRNDLLITAGGRWDQRLQLWKRNGSSWNDVASVPSFSDWWMRGLGVSPNGEALATVAGAGEGSIRLWDISTDELRQSTVLDGLSWATSAIVFSPDGKYVAAGTGSGHRHPNDGQILVWNLKTDPPKLISGVAHTKESAANSGDITALTFATENSLVSGDQAGVIRTWKINDSGELQSVREMKAHPQGVQSLYFARNGQLISSGHDGTAAIWDIASDTPQHRWSFNSQSAVTALAPSFRHCAVGLADGRVYILQLYPERK
jgi:WD40 repeat protein